MLGFCNILTKFKSVHPGGCPFWKEKENNCCSIFLFLRLFQEGIRIIYLSISPCLPHPPPSPNHLHILSHNILHGFLSSTRQVQYPSTFPLVCTCQNHLSLSSQTLSLNSPMHLCCPPPHPPPPPFTCLISYYDHACYSNISFLSHLAPTCLNRLATWLDQIFIQRWGYHGEATFPLRVCTWPWNHLLICPLLPNFVTLELSHAPVLSKPKHPLPPLDIYMFSDFDIMIMLATPI